MRPNLLTVVPGNINIENFVPGRVYKETLMIYNTCDVPIVISLKPSDKNKLTISETTLRIGVNQSKKVDLIIQDKLNYKYTKTPVKQKKLFIKMRGELIDEKYEINLIYYHKNNDKKNINNEENKFNQNLNNNQRRINNYINNNNPYKQIPKGYLTENPNNNNDNYENNLQYNYYSNNYKYDSYNTNPYMNDNHDNQNENEEIISLKKIINDLTNKVIYLESLLNHMPNKNNQNNQYGITNNSLYIFGNNEEKEIKNKYKINENIDNERIISRNKILELENSTLLTRIKYLEKRISLYEHKNENVEFITNNYGVKKEELKENNINQIMKDNKNKNVIQNNNIQIKNNINEKYLNKMDINDYLLRKSQKDNNKYSLNNKILNAPNNAPNQIKTEYSMKDKYSPFYEKNNDMNFDDNKDSS